MDSNRVWFWAHLGFTAALAVLVALSLVTLAVDEGLFFTYSLHAVVIFLFVMPGALLVFAINHLILWRRTPRVFRVADKVVIIIVATLTVITALSSFSFEVGLAIVFLSVPLLMVAGVVSTIVIAVGNSRADQPLLPTTPVEPGTAPVAATLDQLFTEQSAAPAPVPLPAVAEPTVAEPAAGETPYGPKA